MPRVLKTFQRNRTVYATPLVLAVFRHPQSQGLGKWCLVGLQILGAWAAKQTMRACLHIWICRHCNAGGYNSTQGQYDRPIWCTDLCNHIAEGIQHPCTAIHRNFSYHALCLPHMYDTLWNEVPLPVVCGMQVVLI